MNFLAGFYAKNDPIRSNENSANGAGAGMNIFMGLLCVVSMAFLLRFGLALAYDDRRLKKRKTSVYQFKEPL